MLLNGQMLRNLPMYYNIQTQTTLNPKFKGARSCELVCQTKVLIVNLPIGVRLNGPTDQFVVDNTNRNIVTWHGYHCIVRERTAPRSSGYWIQTNKLSKGQRGD